MDNPFKNNSLASCLLGVLIGMGGYAGGDALFSSYGTNVDSNPPGIISEPKDTKKLEFHGLKNNPDGDVVITKSGKKYHSKYGCSSLTSNPKTRTVSRDDAENVGMEACSKCNP